MTLCGQKPYVLTYTKDDAALTLYSCEQDTWKKLYQQKISENYGNEVKLCAYNGLFYFAYADAAGIEIEKLDASCSRVTEKQTIAGAADFDMQAGADGVYLVYTQNKYDRICEMLQSRKFVRDNQSRKLLHDRRDKSFCRSTKAPFDRLLDVCVYTEYRDDGGSHILPGCKWKPQRSE